MATGINESKTLIKHISCNCRSKSNSKQKWNNGKCQCGYKKTRKHCVCEEVDACSPSIYACEYDKDYTIFEK